jgi:type VI secretion system secreted protein VgrG
MWFFSANEAQFLFTVDGCSETLGVLRFSGQEALGANYLFEIDVVCDSEQLDLIALQHQTACLTLQNSPTPRYVHGIVLCAGHIKQDSRHNHYRFHLVPQAELLHYRTDQRIFQNKSVTDIILSVWQTAGLNPSAIRVQTKQACPPLLYCVQYGETDLHFIQRLCEHHGLFYYFEHSAGQHTMVVVDGKENCPKVDAVHYQPDSGQNPDQPVLSQLDWQFQATEGLSEVREYDFTRPDFNLTGKKQTALREWYEYGTQHDSQALATARAGLLLDQQQHERQQAYASGNIRQVYPGCFLPVTEHPLASLNIMWLVASIQHSGEQPQVLKELASGSSKYQNQLVLHHKEMPFALPRQHDKPQLSGFQTALVTGPDGQEIYTDAHGRVKVQFHWDKHASGGEDSSCWLRVAQGWAGATYGQQFLPRIGQEVIVAFAEHDIDRPYVTGCVHNASNTSPIQYPAHHTQSGFRTLSSPGGGGFNELRFEDKKGKEQIVLHAQRNWYRKVKRTSRTEIGGNEHLWIGGEDKRRISGEEHLTVNKNRLTEISGNQDLHVMQNKHLHIDSKWLTKIDQELHVKAGQMLILEASSAMSFDAGGSTLLINSGGIQMQGANVRVNAGGAASPANTPSLAKMLLPAALSAIQLATFKKKAPFCEECEKCKGGHCAIPNS